MHDWRKANHHLSFTSRKNLIDSAEVPIHTYSTLRSTYLQTFGTISPCYLPESQNTNKQMYLTGRCVVQQVPLLARVVLAVDLESSLSMASGLWVGGKELLAADLVALASQGKGRHLGMDSHVWLGLSDTGNLRQSGGSLAIGGTPLTRKSDTW